MSDSGHPGPDLDDVLDMVRRDAEVGRLAAWGRSTVVDENVGAPVVDARVFEALHRAAGLDEAFPVGNAGLLHVYGYWFSDVVTPYGRKRDRWTNGRLARAFGLASDAFHLDGDSETTLLERVTDAALPVLLAPHESAMTADRHVDDLRTRVVLHRRRGADATALVYGVGQGDDLRVVTAFPLAGDPRAVLSEFVAEARLRWNAAPPRKS